MSRSPQESPVLRVPPVPPVLLAPQVPQVLPLRQVPHVAQVVEVQTLRWGEPRRVPDGLRVLGKREVRQTLWRVLQGQLRRVREEQQPAPPRLMAWVTTGSGSPLEMARASRSASSRQSRESMSGEEARPADPRAWRIV